MRRLRSWLFRLADFFVQHDVFIRFMIVLMVFVSGVTTARSPGLFSEVHSEFLSLILTAFLFASLPDVLVVVVGHPLSRRSQLVLSAVVTIMSVCIYLFRGTTIGVPVTR